MICNIFKCWYWNTLIHLNSIIDILRYHFWISGRGCLWFHLVSEAKMGVAIPQRRQKFHHPFKDVRTQRCKRSNNNWYAKIKNIRYCNILYMIKSFEWISVELVFLVILKIGTKVRQDRLIGFPASLAPTCCEALELRHFEHQKHWRNSVIKKCQFNHTIVSQTRTERLVCGRL